MLSEHWSDCQHGHQGHLAERDDQESTQGLSALWQQKGPSGRTGWASPLSATQRSHHYMNFINLSLASSIT